MLHRTMAIHTTRLRSEFDLLRRLRTILSHVIALSQLPVGVGSMVWQPHLRRLLSVAVYVAVAVLLLYPGLVLAQLDLINSKILFPVLALMFLLSSPAALMRH